MLKFLKGEKTLSEISDFNHKYFQEFSAQHLTYKSENLKFIQDYKIKQTYIL